MILILIGQKYTFENNESGVNESIEKINKVLSNENLFFSHLIVDAQEIYSELEEYILDHIEKIEVVEVKTMTIDEFVSSLIISLNDYTKRGIPEIERIVNEFYQSPTEKSWLTLNQLLEGIEWIYQTIKNIDNTDHRIADWDEYIKSVATYESELPNLLEAIENKDSVLIADIIQYEISPQFQLIHDKTEQSFEVK